MVNDSRSLLCRSDLMDVLSDTDSETKDRLLFEIIILSRSLRIYSPLSTDHPPFSLIFTELRMKRLVFGLERVTGPPRC